MALTADSPSGEITLGPVLFNWRPETWRDFYFRIADEAPVSTVYLGEVICSKRGPFYEPHYDAVARRLVAAGKSVVFSTLAEVVLNHDRQSVSSVCALTDYMVEANDASALRQLQGRPHSIGPFMNVYNEQTLAFLARHGATNVCLPVELPAPAIGALCQHAAAHGIMTEVQVFGRMPLALSARCYHARVHGRTKDSCQFVCEKDPDGLELRTLAEQSFLAINGVQTLSFDYLNLINELPELAAFGVTRFRVSPHTCEMIVVTSAFRDVLERRISIKEGISRLDAIKLAAPFSNGFYYGKPGYRRITPSAASGTNAIP